MLIVLKLHKGLLKFNRMERDVLLKLPNTRVKYLTIRLRNSPLERGALDGAVAGVCLRCA
jgi:hypothetical protein